MRLEAANLEAEARSLTGFTGFGEPQFRRGLAQLVKAIREEAALTKNGLAAQRQRLVGLLVNRLRLVQALKEHPEIGEQQIEAPIVIVGLPRTGSTMTHRLLASDPGHTAMLWWEGRYPAMLPSEERGRPDARRALGQAEVEAVVAASPEALDIHPWDFEGADEEVLLVEHSFHSSVPEAFMQLPGYSRWVSEQDHTVIYEDLRTWLRYLQWQNPGREQRRWVLKSPHHLGYLDALLAVFPDACIVQTHRTPLDTVPSFCSMCANLTAPLTKALDLTVVGAQVTAKLERDLSLAMAVAERSPERFLDLRFVDMVRDPIACMRRVYEFAGESFGDRAEAAMRACREDDGHQPGVHHFALAEYGLSAAAVEERFAAYIERYQF